MANLTVTDTQLNKMTQSIRGAINEKYGSDARGVQGDRHRPERQARAARSCARSRRSSSTSRASTCCSSCSARRAARARPRPPPRPRPGRPRARRRRAAATHAADARPPAQLSDTNGDDEIDFDEFVAGLKARPPALAARALLATPASRRLPQPPPFARSSNST